MNGGGEGAPVENGGDNSGSDIIRISGKKEKCEAAAAALQELVPVNLEVSLVLIIILMKPFCVPQCKNLLSVFMMIVSSQLIQNVENKPYIRSILSLTCLS